MSLIELGESKLISLFCFNTTNHICSYFIYKGCNPESNVSMWSSGMWSDCLQISVVSSAAKEICILFSSLYSNSAHPSQTLSLV